MEHSYNVFWLVDLCYLYSYIWPLHYYGWRFYRVCLNEGNVYLLTLRRFVLHLLKHSDSRQNWLRWHFFLYFYCYDWLMLMMSLISAEFYNLFYSVHHHNNFQTRWAIFYERLENLSLMALTRCFIICGGLLDLTLICLISSFGFLYGRFYMVLFYKGSYDRHAFLWTSTSMFYPNIHLDL